mmetsp:Transcript_78103/g.203497  ORF Transcript_78103/g.203497 Transcript_78103/m.203497 type:complete len:231 (+) Transcript_78103:1140-1832(+)
MIKGLSAMDSSSRSQRICLSAPAWDKCPLDMVLSAYRLPSLTSSTKVTLQKPPRPRAHFFLKFLNWTVCPRLLTPMEPALAFQPSASRWHHSCIGQSGLGRSSPLKTFFRILAMPAYSNTRQVMPHSRVSTLDWVIGSPRMSARSPKWCPCLRSASHTFTFFPSGPSFHMYCSASPALTTYHRFLVLSVPCCRMRSPGLKVCTLWTWQASSYLSVLKRHCRVLTSSRILT